MAESQPGDSYLARMRIATTLVLLASSLLACSAGDESGGDTGWARRVVPVDEHWRPLSQVPREPQSAPQMVLWEVTQFPPESPPSQEQHTAAAEFVERCHRAALEHGWYDFKQGLADGYRLMVMDRRHYENHEYILDDHVLDPDRPEFLMYYGTPRGKVLTGFMFYNDTPSGHGPQIGGNLTLWHYHVWKTPMCLLEGLISLGLADDRGQCKRGTVTHRSPEMLHVWLVDHPNGPFTTSMMLAPDLLEKLVEKRSAARPETVTR